MSKTYIITGTSSGLGRALAQAVLERGDQVVLTARRIEAVADLVERYKEKAIAVRMDVTQAQDRKSAVQAALEQFGRIDVLVNNAGRGSLGAAEEFSVEQIRDQIEVNFIACAEMIREVLPVMRARHSGHIVNITSIGGRVNVGGFALYGASKFALEGYSEALHDEVKPLGIKVTLVEPGAFRTDFAGDSNLRPASSIADYQPFMEPLRQFLYGNSGKQAGNPHKAALVIIQAIENGEPPLRLMLGADAYGLWDSKRAATDIEMAKWRAIGQDTAFPDGQQIAIPDTLRANPSD